MLKKIKSLSYYRFVITLLSTTINLLLYWSKLVSIITALSAGVLGSIFAWMKGYSTLGIILMLLSLSSLLSGLIYLVYRFKRLTKVHNQPFRQEKVDATGKHFVQCQFEEVSILWDKRSCFERCHFTGKIKVELKEKRLIEFSQFLETLGLLASGSFEEASLFKHPRKMTQKGRKTNQ